MTPFRQARCAAAYAMRRRAIFSRVSGVTRRPDNGKERYEEEATARYQRVG